MTFLPRSAHGTTAQRPVHLAAGALYFDTDLDKVVQWTGAAWVDASPAVQTVIVQFVSAGVEILTQGGAGTVQEPEVKITTSDGAILEVEVTVDVIRTGGTATDPAHYTNDFPQTLTFPVGAANNSTQNYAVTHANNVAPSQTIILGLDNEVGATIGAQSTHTVTLTILEG